MICARIFCAFALCSLLVTSGCKPIPTEPEPSLDGLVYTNNSWGFRVSRPSDQWGIDVSTLTSQRDINGLSPVTVRILSPEITGDFRPQMHLYPQALPNRFATMTVDQIVQEFEEQYLMLAFDQYRVIGEKQRIRLNVGEAIQWQFRYSQLERSNRDYPGTRFLVAIAIHNQVGYYMIGNGSRDAGYPLTEYEQIVASLEFR
ncbi:MAG: hypothetical protein OXI94_16500 [Gemmatimonadota bacterium]|nr:hypothetical protein [Gemmatimonadota bacterium]MDE2829133.1 hypothetical protein [Gemmatimonadota bacterium]